MIRAVLFDIVGTLIELREPAGATYSRIAREHGVTVPATHLEDGFRRVFAAAPPMMFPEALAAEIPVLEKSWWRERVRQTLRAADGTARFEDFDAFFEELFGLFATNAPWRVFDGATEVLDRLRREGLALAVLSNFDHRLPALLAALGLDPYFERVFLPGEIRAAKPDPRIFTAALAGMGVSAEEAVYVGDDPERDLEPARALGIRAIHIQGPDTLRRVILDVFTRRE